MLSQNCFKTTLRRPCLQDAGNNLQITYYSDFLHNIKIRFAKRRKIQGPENGPALLSFTSNMTLTTHDWQCPTNSQFKVNGNTFREGKQTCQFCFPGLLLPGIQTCPKFFKSQQYTSYNVYYMDNESIQPVTEEKDLGVIISEDLKPSKHCAEVVKKANMVLGLF